MNLHYSGTTYHHHHFHGLFFLNWPLVAIRSRAVVREGSEGAFGVSEKRTSFCLSLYHYQPPQILKPNDRSEKRGWTKKVLLHVFIEYISNCNFFEPLNMIHQLEEFFQEKLESIHIEIWSFPDPDFKIHLFLEIYS